MNRLRIVMRGGGNSHTYPAPPPRSETTTMRGAAWRARNGRSRYPVTRGFLRRIASGTNTAEQQQVFR